MRIFILDDKRCFDEAVRQAFQSDERAAEFAARVESHTLCRNITEGNTAVWSLPVFDVWILDNDLGYNAFGKLEEGFAFLKFWVEYPELVPPVVLSCSANPARRRDIDELFKNWHRNGRQPLKPIGA